MKTGNVLVPYPRAAVPQRRKHGAELQLDLNKGEKQNAVGATEQSLSDELMGLS